MDATSLLNQFLGGNAGAQVQQAGDVAKQKLGSMGGMGTMGTLAAGCLLGALLGSKKVRKMAGGAVGYGGAAALGALAFKAYQNYQQGQVPASAPPATPADVPQVEQRFLPDAAPASDGMPFQLVLIQAMVGAAKADGHVDADEQKMLFEQVEQMGLDAEGKAFVFDALNKPADLDALAKAAATPEQAAEIYLVSRLAIDPDHPAERAYLEALAHRLNLPSDLVAHLNRQAEAGFPE